MIDACDKSPGFISLNETERALLADVLAVLSARNPAEAESLRARFEDVEALGSAVSRFPCFKEARLLAVDGSADDPLILSLLRLTGRFRYLHTPTRVLTGRAFLASKIHALSYASLAVFYDLQLRERLRGAMLNVVSALLLEDVYLTCLEDPSFPVPKKESLAEDLITLWDQWRDPRELSHAPALSELWSARDAQMPVFGTMEGACELMRISFDLEGPWLAFVASRLEEKEAQDALEEFLFGLAYEEIEAVRGHMARFGLCTADAAVVRSIIGDRQVYESAVGSDPRAMYEFYAERREAARSRRRGGAPGPKRTLEELYLSYLISEKE